MCSTFYGPPILISNTDDATDIRDPEFEGVTGKI